jgi:predicted transcriptional regulator YdeE
MQPTTQSLGSFTVVGIARRQSNDHPDEIGKLWQDFSASGGVKQIPNRKSDDIYAVYTEYEGDHTKPYTMVLGCEVTEVGSLPKGLVAKIISDAKYAVFDAKGPQPTSVISAWKHIWSSSLVRAYTADFDHYHGPEDVHVHVAVR